MRERPSTDEQFERAATQDLLAGGLLGGDVEEGLEEGPDGGMAWPVLDASACYGLAGAWSNTRPWSSIRAWTTNG